MIEEFLSEAATSITSCWHLQDDDLAVVERAVPQYLPQLEGLAKHSTFYRQRASYLAAQAFLLLDSVAYHHLRFTDGIGYCEQAVEYARESGDLTLLLVALEELGSALRAHGPETKMIAIYQQAETYSINTELSGVLRSKIRSGLGLASAQQGKSEETTRFLNEARALFTEENKELPVFLVGCHSLLDIILNEGRSDLALGDQELRKKNVSSAQKYYKGAAEKFAEIEQLPSGIIVPSWGRVKIDNYRALAYAKVGNMEGFEKYFIQGANGSRKMRSKKREQEVWDNLIFAIQQWPHEQQVVKLLSWLR
jgi:tetratricopeptide (TPR) repeat protein